MLGKHTSVDKHLKSNIKWLQALPAVTKVVLGFCEACRHRYAPGVMRHKMDVDGGIKLNAYSGTGVMDVFVKIHPISEREQVKHSINRKFA